MALDIYKFDEAERLAKQLAECQQKRKKAESDRRELEDALVHLLKKRQEIDEGLQETLSTIKRRLDRLTITCRFRESYYEQAKKRLFGTQSSMALQQTSEATADAKRKILDYDSKIGALDARIRDIEERLRQLNQENEVEGMQ